MRILVALSGGIDSSVMAHLLKQEGHELVGVRFTLWSDPLAPFIANVLPSKCCNPQTAYRARKTAETLEIPYHIVDLEKEFKENVVDPFLEGYKAGLTPNPCIGCNRTIKFGKLIELMKEYNCERLATGHYARTAVETLSDGSQRHLLLEALDTSKDQSYYLYGLSQKTLSKVIFPLGTMFKEQVFGLAQHFGVPYEEESYRESQDLCFFPEKSPDAFLKRHLKDFLKPGNIVRRDGTVVGEHKGLPLYTIGQRKLGIGGMQIPLELVEKNSERNELVVEEKEKEKAYGVRIQNIHFISWSPVENETIDFECRTRSLSAKKRGSLTWNGTSGSFQFLSPAELQAPGQSIVFYRGEEVVGGGVIAG